MDIHEIRRFAGNMSQFSGITEITADSGKTRGMRIYHFQAGNGLEFDLVPDKALDIAKVTYKGVNINWLGKPGYTSPLFAHPVKNEFSRYFCGGMLMTCGLKNTGPEYENPDGPFQVMHGRVNITPCEQSYARTYFTDDDYILEAGGVIRDATMWAHNLTLTRTVRTSLSKAEIEISDTLENQQRIETDYVILYHFNFGYPFLSPKIQIDIPLGDKPIKPRTPWAEKYLSTWNKFEGPEDQYEERCYFHFPKADAHNWTAIHVTNPELGIQAQLAYDETNLPILTQWKSIQTGEYVLGIEPGNSFISGLKNERINGRVDTIGGFEKKEFHIKLSFSQI